MVTKRDYICTPACKDILSAHFSTIVHQIDFGNGRYVRKLLELTLYQQAKRLMAGDISRLSKKELREIRKSDIVHAIKEIDSKKKVHESHWFWQVEYINVVLWLTHH